MNEMEICKSLVDILNAYEGGTSLVSNQRQALDGYSALANFISVAKNARHLISSLSGCATATPICSICDGRYGQHYSKCSSKSRTA